MGVRIRPHTPEGFHQGLSHRSFRSFTSSTNYLIHSITSRIDLTRLGKIMSYQEEFNFALALVKKCGETIKTAFNSEKSAANDLVTETDQEVEKALIGGLREKFPDTRFIGEESTAGGVKCELSKEPTWIIDPIDGTTNFIHSNPNICTILAFMVAKEVEFCIVHNPIHNQTLTAQKGRGAFCDGKRIKVSGCQTLEKCLLI